MAKVSKKKLCNSSSSSNSGSSSNSWSKSKSKSKGKRRRKSFNVHPVPNTLCRYCEKGNCFQKNIPHLKKFKHVNDKLFRIINAWKNDTDADNVINDEIYLDEIIYDLANDLILRYLQFKNSKKKKKTILTSSIQNNIASNNRPPLMTYLSEIVAKRNDNDYTEDQLLELTSSLISNQVLKIIELVDALHKVITPQNNLSLFMPGCDGNIYLYRGFKPKYKRYLDTVTADLKKSDVLTSKCILSTSMSENVAYNFIGSTNTDYDVVWKIVVPIKFLNQLPPAYFLTDSYRVTTNMSKYQYDEIEILLNIGVKLKLLSVETFKGGEVLIPNIKNAFNKRQINKHKYYTFEYVGFDASFLDKFKTDFKKDYMAEVTKLSKKELIKLLGTIPDE